MQKDLNKSYCEENKSYCNLSHSLEYHHTFSILEIPFCYFLLIGNYQEVDNIT